MELGFLFGDARKYMNHERESEAKVMMYGVRIFLVYLTIAPSDLSAYIQ